MPNIVVVFALRLYSEFAFGLELAAYSGILPLAFPFMPSCLVAFMPSFLKKRKPDLSYLLP